MGLLGKLLKTAIDVATIPVDVAKDVITMGGTLTDKNRPYTSEKLRRLNYDVEEIRDAADEL